MCRIISNNTSCAYLYCHINEKLKSPAIIIIAYFGISKYNFSQSVENGYLNHISSTFKKKSIYQWLFYFKQEVLKQYTEFTAFTRHIDGLDPFFLSLVNQGDNMMV
jgi:hypothetical protein